ncbi:Cell wall integrity and stress response component 4 [Colletotrichum orbiculare MAFF 240422]|uniref:Cell wall integrity and stress response component 4 n=1 Tax=Colletotrichum orbiculare (strain 104-T / ATCC 96160 / CBS 514.97 / LARS 414 / MAFF 240422) TaxID=1213857 RepID=A0A484FZ28_COLOR|nr:Cell wall integrity and stress response component 4 [Colletotrichum orbiculare MAFF 240422]
MFATVSASVYHNLTVRSLLPLTSRCDSWIQRFPGFPRLAFLILHVSFVSLDSGNCSPFATLRTWLPPTDSREAPMMLQPRQLKQSLCSNQNTASGSANTSIWQTNGLCQDFCTEKNAAFAIVQWQSCWCSDVAPASSTEADVDEKCTGICPGYDVEHCGSRPEYYSYISLAKLPTSTAGGGGDGTTKQPSTSAPPAPSPTTVKVTVTETESPQTTAKSDPETTTTKSSTTSTTSRPRTTVQTVTADGTVRTVTVTPAATETDGASGAAEQGSSTSESSGKGVSGGTIAGIVVGVIGGLCLAAGVLLMILFRRKRQNRENEKFDEPSHRGSSAGMTGSPRNPEMVVTVEGGRWDADSTSDHRRSRLMPHDPRLEPLGRGLYMNKSDESVNTLRDDQDYSRKVHRPVLRAMNPDPA